MGRRASLKMFIAPESFASPLSAFYSCNKIFSAIARVRSFVQGTAPTFIYLFLVSFLYFPAAFSRRRRQHSSASSSEQTQTPPPPMNIHIFFTFFSLSWLLRFRGIVLLQWRRCCKLEEIFFIRLCVRPSALTSLRRWTQRKPTRRLQESSE